MSNSAESLFMRCEFRFNFASSAAGAIATTGPVVLNLTGNDFVENSASRYSTLLGYNDDNRALYSLVNNVIISSKGVVSSMLGRVAFSGNERVCARGGYGVLHQSALCVLETSLF